ncbi:MAG TPA: DUF4123 domain-containing protein [Aliidongia sp.]|nr:DUF4123 domain-containing protein [Aliidongia sp.]
MSDPTADLRRLRQAPAFVGCDPEARLFCVIDAASDTRIYPALRRFAARERIVSLYQGNTAVELASAAPYLVEPHADGALLGWLFDELQDECWGILLWSTAPLEELRAHFRRLSRVRTEDGRTLLFRLYDPRVLATFLPMCDEAQLTQTFGPISVFGASVPDSWDVTLLTQASGAILEATLSLEPAE